MNLLLLRLSYLLLLLVGVSGLFTLAPQDSPLIATVIIALLLYGPLLLIAPALISGHRRLLTWLCFILLFYFCGYTMQLFAEPPIRTLAVVKTSLTVMTFVLAAIQIRFAARHDAD